MKYISILVVTIFAVILIGCKSGDPEDKGPKLAPNYLWAKKAGGSSMGTICSVCTDESGNVYVTGSFDNEAEYNGGTKLSSTGQDDIFISKFKSDGTFIWAKSAGGNGIDKGTGIASDKSGNIYITGTFEGTAKFDKTSLKSAGDEDIFIAKYSSSDGKLIWAKRVGGKEQDYAFGITTDLSGSIYITGAFENNSKFDKISLTSSGNEDIFLAKFSPDGKVQWAKKAGGTQKDYAFAITVDNSGWLYITGFFEGTSKFENTEISSNGFEDMFLAKYNSSDGKLLWLKKGGGEKKDIGNSLAFDNIGNIYVTGCFSVRAKFGDTTLISSGREDIYVIKYDTDGDLAWAKQYGGNDIDIANCIRLDNTGNYYITGEFSSTAHFGKDSLTSMGDSDVFLAKFNKDGKPVWTANSGGTKTDFGYSMSIDLNNKIYLAGYYSGRAKFGVDELTSSTRNIFLTSISEVLTTTAGK
jgi:uncharacterized protein (AIM24 family)